MHRPLPSLNALRAFEAAARHLSFTKAAQELHVTPGALSHQIAGLEEVLGLKLFERGVRSIALTRHGGRLYPGLRVGFAHIRDAVEALGLEGNGRALVISTLAGRLGMPGWADWFEAAGIKGVDVSRGLRFSSADHALDATVEGAGVLLTHDILVYDELRTGRLVMPFRLSLSSGRIYGLVCPKARRDQPNVRVFRDWIKQEMGKLQREAWLNGPAAAA